MPSADLFHCHACGARPAINLVAYAGKLTRPECLYEINARQAAHQTLAPPPADTAPGWLARALEAPVEPRSAIVAEPVRAELPAPVPDLGLVVQDSRVSEAGRGRRAKRRTV